MAALLDRLAGDPNGAGIGIEAAAAAVGVRLFLLAEWCNFNLLRAMRDNLEATKCIPK